MVRLAAPSKTYLLGEYAVLAGGPGLVMATEPRFELVAVPGQGGSNIDPEAPAGKWLNRHQALLADYQLTFVDPHAGRGGFGASSAAFLLSWALVHQLQQQALPGFAKLLADYQALDGGSGMDVVAQRLGGLAACHRHAERFEALAWPFAQLELLVIRTGKKLVTYQHLQALADDLPFQSLQAIANDALQAVAEADAEVFVALLVTYGEVLAAAGLVAEYSQSLLTELRGLPAVLAAKGCGAMGADALVVCVPTGETDAVRQWAKSHALDVVFQGQRFAGGLEFIAPG